MVITAQTIITAGSVLTALGIIITLILKVHKWYLKQEEQDAEIKRIKEDQDTEIKRIKRENTLICYALYACLDGLAQLGANHTVPKAKEKLDKFLNEEAHQQ